MATKALTNLQGARCETISLKGLRFEMHTLDENGSSIQVILCNHWPSKTMLKGTMLTGKTHRPRHQVSMCASKRSVLTKHDKKAVISQVIRVIHDFLQVMSAYTQTDWDWLCCTECFPVSTQSSIATSQCLKSCVLHILQYSSPKSSILATLGFAKP